MKRNLLNLLPLLFVGVIMFGSALPIQASTPTSYPTKTDLAGYYTSGQLCVAVYFSEQVCNDVLFVGTYNNWNTTPSECAKFQPLTGFAGWYVVAVTDDSSIIAGKPVQLAGDGSFSWTYQTGDVDSWTLVSGYVSITTNGVSGESDLTNYDTSEPVILVSDYFKNHNSPCGDVRHTYTINLKAPACGGFTPAIKGDFNLWGGAVAMGYDSSKSMYSYTFAGNEGETVMFLAYGYDDMGNDLLIYEDGSWSITSITLTDQLTYTLDYSDGKYTLCSDETGGGNSGGSVTDGGSTIYYIFDEANLTAQVTYRGSSYDEYTNEYTGDVVIPATVTYEGKTYSVTSIGEYAFFDCSGLTSITIPNSVTSIGEYAFYGCSGLTSVVWNAKNCVIVADVNVPFVLNDLPFYDICSQITSFTFGNEVEHIPAYLCYGMSNLTSVTIPNSVTSIGEDAFWDCSGLTSVTIGNSVESIGRRAFYGCSSLPVVDNLRYADTYLVEAVDKSLSTYTIKAGTKWIGEYAFYECTSLTSITIPNSVISIGEGAFSGCSGLTSVVVERGNTKYDSRNNCNAIIETATNTLIAGCQSTTIPNSVTSIGDCAFLGCSSLTSITIGNSVESIGEVAFQGCSSLTSVMIPNSVESIGAYAFYDCSGLTEVTIGNSVESIGDGAFYGCSSLTSVTIPNSVTSIGDYAFYECSGLTSVTIGNSVESIGEEAFYGCSGLTSVTIGNSVTSIEGEAFKGCSNITSVVWNAVNYADFSSNTDAPFYESLSTITSFTFGHAVEHIPAYLCSGMENLSEITIGNSVKSIGSSAFAGCTKLINIVCYAAEPPSCDASAFANYNVFLKVPCDNLMAYQTHVCWGSFKYISCIGSDEVQVTEFSVTPSTNEAQFTWPVEPNAATYELVISKDGVVFCTLTFNANGQLMGIAFAPSANAPAAVPTTSGFQFTVTGLVAASHYTYTFDAKDAGGNVIKHYAGEFNTEGSTVGLEQIELANIYTQDGRIVCEGEFRIYDLLGRDVTRLNGSLCGVYVVKSGNAAVKVVVK